MNNQWGILNNNLQKRFADDQSMIDYIKRRYEENRIFYSYDQGQWGANENNRRTQENIREFTQEQMNIRIDRQYKRIFSTLFKDFPDLINGAAIAWENYWRGRKELENKCRYYCTPNLLNDETDEFIKTSKNELISSGYEERVDHIDQNLQGAAIVHNQEQTNGLGGRTQGAAHGHDQGQASGSQGATYGHDQGQEIGSPVSDGKQAIDDAAVRKQEEAQKLEVEKQKEIQRAEIERKRIDEEKRTYAFEILTSNLLIWYPSSFDRSSFDHKLISFMRLQNFTTNSLQQIASNRNSFENAIFSPRTMKDFETKFKDDMRYEIRYIFKMTLWNKHGNIADYHKNILSRLENEVENSRLDSIYLVWKLEERIKKARDDVMLEAYNAAMEGLENKLNEWNPDLETFNSKFINFLRVTKPSLGTIKYMAAQGSNRFYSSHNTFLKDYFDTNRNNFIAAMYEKVYKILHKLDAVKEERNLKLLRYKKIGQQFTIEMMGYQSQLEELVNAEINKLNKCIEGLSDRIENIIHNATMFKFFSDNRCIADEICLRNSDISERDLNTKLKPYVKVYSKSRADPFAKGNQTVDEIDEAIYDLIQTFIRDKFEVIEHKKQCFVDFLRRSKDFEEAYSPEAIFDDDHEMWKKIESLVQKYVDEYLIQLKSTDQNYLHRV